MENILIEQGFVEVPGGSNSLPPVAIYFKKISQQQVSAKRPTMLFLHGGPGITDHQQYFAYWSRFVTDADIEFIDMRGHGQSGAHGSEYQHTWCLHQWADDIIHYCQARDIEKPVIVGFSFGGWVAYDFLTRYPNFAKQMIIVNSEPWVNVELRADCFQAKAMAAMQEADKPNEEQIAQGEKIKQIIFSLRDAALHPETTANDSAGATADLYIRPSAKLRFR